MRCVFGHLWDYAGQPVARATRAFPSLFTPPRLHGSYFARLFRFVGFRSALPPLRMRPLRLAALSALVGLPLLSACTAPQRALGPDVVAAWHDQTLSLSQFETEYARQNGGRTAAQDDSLARMQDFLRRYVDFRLKVREAERLRYESRPEIRDELDRYVQEYAGTYLLNQRVLEPIVREVYDRQATLVDASHILISLPRTASPEDTLAARARLTAIVDSVRAGHYDFGTAAARYSQDPSAQRPAGPGSRGRLGYFSSGDMVEEFEEAAYGTPVGQMSPILRTQFGYHVLYVHDTRATPEAVNVAHIMVSPQGPTEADKAAARARIDSLRARVAAGEDFGALAQQYSVDEGSAARGGDLGFFDYRSLQVEPFRTVAFGMTTPGEVSDVVETDFGYHLIKFIARRARPSFEEAAPTLRQQAARMPRAQRLRTEMQGTLARTYNVRVDSAAVRAVLGGMPLDSVRTHVAAGHLGAAALARPVVFVGDSTYTFGQVAGSAFARQLPPAAYGNDVTRLTQSFTDEALMRYAARDLPRRDAEFGRLMTDFRDGTLLFKLMEDSVWSRAQTDTAALRRRYAATRATLAPMPARTRLVVFSAADDAALRAVTDPLAAGTSAETILSALPVGIEADTLLLSGPSGTPFDAALTQPEGQFLGPIGYRQNARAIVLRHGVEAARAKTFEEAMPELVTGYQRDLEERLLARLRAAGRTVLFPERLRRAFGGTAVGAGNAAPAGAARQ